MIRSPVDCKGLIRSKFVKEMIEIGFLEIKRWPKHIPDEMIIDEIANDRGLMLYVINSKGIPLYTHAGVKGFFTNIHPQLLQNPSYNTKVLAKKHHPNQKDSA